MTFSTNVGGEKEGTLVILGLQCNHTAEHNHLGEHHRHATVNITAVVPKYARKNRIRCPSVKHLSPIELNDRVTLAGTQKL